MKPPLRLGLKKKTLVGLRSDSFDKEGQCAQVRTKPIQPLVTAQTLTILSWYPLYIRTRISHPNLSSSRRRRRAAPHRRPLHRSFSNGVHSRNQQEAEGKAPTRPRVDASSACVAHGFNVSSCVVCSPARSQFVADGVFFAELNEMLTRELAEDGYSGVEVRVTPMRTEIIIRATRTQNVLGMCTSTTPIPITAVR